MKLSKLYRLAIALCCASNCYPSDRNYVEVSNINKWNYDSEITTNAFGIAGTSLPNFVDITTSADTKILLSADGPLFITQDGLLFLLDNDKIVIDPENLVKGIGVDVYTVLPGRYYFDFTALNTNDNVIAKITKEKTFPRAAFQSNVDITNRSLSFALESQTSNIDKFIVSVDNPTNKVKKIALGSVRLIEKAVTLTNNVTIVEGIPNVLRGEIAGKTFTWYHNGDHLHWETNNFINIPYPLEASGGVYVLRSGNSSITFNVLFQRNITVYINNEEVEGNVIEIPLSSTGSNIKLAPFVNGLPIRYTLDGSEPTERSELYTNPFTLAPNNKALDKNNWYLRAKIIIPETDSTHIKRSSTEN